MHQFIAQCRHLDRWEFRLWLLLFAVFVVPLFIVGETVSVVIAEQRAHVSVASHNRHGTTSTIPLQTPTPTATFIATTMPTAEPSPSLQPTPTAPIEENVDSDFDGISNLTECNPNRSCPDSDRDGKPDYIDIDSDSDGILDRTEAVVIAIVGRSVRPVDLDGDGVADYLDADSDNDTVPDAIEGHDANADGRADLLPNGLDLDQDGLDDAYDTVQSGHSVENAAGSNAPLPNTSGELPNWRNGDDDGDAIPTIVEIGRNRAQPLDEDGDGVPNYLQPLISFSLYLPMVRQ
ncbi:MAG: hypothetical protein R2932_43985 [Caldilineaceae bacterium]